MPGPGPLRGVDRAAFAVAFAARLRAAGMPVGVTAVEEFARAVGAAPIDTRGRLYWVARSVLPRRRDELEIFDAVFAAVFDDAGLRLDPPARRTPPPVDGGTDRAWARTTGVPADEQAGGGLPWITRPAVVDADEARPTGQPVPQRWPSALEALADAPFGELDEPELARVGGFLEAALPHWPVRPGRRRRVHPAGDRPALRATLARARRTGWEPIEIVRTRTTTRPRRVLMLCDVSRSMQPTTTAYLHLMRAAAVHTPTEVFAFATRLDPVDPGARAPLGPPGRAAGHRPGRPTGSAAPGSRATWPRCCDRGRARSSAAATVVIASDGWDTDPPADLDRAHGPAAPARARGDLGQPAGGRARLPAARRRDGRGAAALRRAAGRAQPAHPARGGGRDHPRRLTQLQSVTWIEGRKCPRLTPDPRSMACVARGVVMNRISSSATGVRLCRGGA